MYWDFTCDYAGLAVLLWDVAVVVADRAGEEQV